MREVLFRPLNYIFHSVLLMILPIFFEGCRKFRLGTFKPFKLFLEICRLLIVLYMFFQFSFEISLDTDSRASHHLVSKILIIVFLIAEFLVNPTHQFDPPYSALNPNPKPNLLYILSKTIGFLSVFLYFALPKSGFAKFLDILLVFYFPDCEKTFELWSVELKRNEKTELFAKKAFSLIKFIIWIHLLTCLGLVSEFFGRDGSFLKLKESGMMIEAYFYCLVTILRLFFINFQENYEEGTALRHFILLTVWLVLFISFCSEFTCRSLSSCPSPIYDLNKYLKVNPMGLETEMTLRSYLSSYERGFKNEDLSNSLDLIKSFDKKLKDHIFKGSQMMMVSNYSHLFLRFSQTTNRRLIKMLKYRLIRPGEFAFKQGEINPSVMMIISGKFELSFKNKSNDKTCIAFQTIQVS